MDADYNNLSLLGYDRERVPSRSKHTLSSRVHQPTTSPQRDIQRSKLSGEEI